MKLRFHDGSIRLRLSQAEVARAAAGETVTASTPMSGGALTCRLTPMPADPPAFSARFDNGAIEVSAPVAQTRAWASSNDEGMYADQTLAGGGLLKIAIEKDYACLHKPEENADTFPNPAHA